MNLLDFNASADQSIRQSESHSNPALAAHEVVEELAGEIRVNVVDALVNCHERLRIDVNDLIARARLGLILLMLYQDDEGYRELQVIFLQRPAWRPFLRLLVNEAKRQRNDLLARMCRRL